MDKRRNIVFEVVHGEEKAFTFERGLIVFFGLEGTVHITCQNREYELCEAGVLAIDPFAFYRVHCGDGGTVIALHIRRALLQMAGWSETRQCACYARNAEAVSYNEVRRLYATLFQDFFQDAEQNASRIASGAIQLVGLLVSRFSTPATPAAGQREQTMQRLKRILDLIHDCWNEELSLSDIAAREYLSVSYLSRFFQKHLHTTFTVYLTDLRLHHAAQMLITQSDSVTQIAYECGFRNISAFIGYFRTHFGVTPGQYRAMKREELGRAATGIPQTDVREGMATLLHYAEQETEKREVPHTVLQVGVCCDETGTPLRNTWRNLCNIGYARDGLLADVREQVRRAQQEIGFHYLRFHGLFDDDMKIYMEDSAGIPYYNFTYTDLLFDFICSLDLRPYVELSFLPPLLAREQTRIFDRVTVISGCNDLNKWSALVHATLIHFIERYGRETVRTWRFTTVSISYAFLGCMTIEEYFDLYQATYRVVKSVDAGIAFGGPGGFANLVWEPNAYRRFLSYTIEHKCVPDFFAVQCYPHRAAGRDPAFMDFTTSQQSAPTVLSSDVDFMKNVRRQLETLFAEFDLTDRPIWFEECNSTLWQRDLSGDTCYKAVWMAKNFCENYDAVEAFGYWLLTDFIDEHAALSSVFHGGYGLFTYNGIPKSGYQAMRFLRQLGDRLVNEGDGWFLTRRGDDFQLLLYNYCHYDNLYRYRYRRLEAPQDAYSVFQTGTVRHMRFVLTGLPDGVYRMETQSISRPNGSSFDKWLEIGAPEYMRPDELRYLAEVSQPSYFVRAVRAEGGLLLEETLYPLETRLILLHKTEG